MASNLQSEKEASGQTEEANPQVGGVAVSDAIAHAIRLAQRGIREGICAVFVKITNTEHLHQALALPHSPLKPASTAQESAEAFLEWLRPKDVERETTTEMPAYIFMTSECANTMVYGNWMRIPWNVAMHDAGVGAFCKAYRMDWLGRNRTQLYELQQVFHVT
jgi:hypothetical protein